MLFASVQGAESVKYEFFRKNLAIWTLCSTAVQTAKRLEMALILPFSYWCRLKIHLNLPSQRIKIKAVSSRLAVSTALVPFPVAGFHVSGPADRRSKLLNIGYGLDALKRSKIGEKVSIRLWDAEVFYFPVYTENCYAEHFSPHTFPRKKKSDNSVSEISYRVLLAARRSG